MKRQLISCTFTSSPLVGSKGACPLGQCLLASPVLAALAVCLILTQVATLLISPVLAANATTNKDAVAVIIGNRDYANSVPDVDFAHNDADAMKRFVIEVLGFREGNIIDLRNATMGQLTAVFGAEDNVEGQLHDWVKEGKSDVVVFYSGHGAPGLRDRRGYLVPVDADPRRIELTGYPVDLLYANLAQIPARRMTVYLDACFSGETPKGMIIDSASAIILQPKLPAAASGMTVLTAASRDQVANWDNAAKQGLFTRYLLQALRGKADAAPYGDGDGAVTLAEVGRYLDEEMTYRSKRLFGAAREQRATAIGDEGVVLASLTPEPSPPPAEAISPNTAADDALQLVLWEGANEINTSEAYVDYLARFPDGLFASQARFKLKVLKGGSAEDAQIARLSEPALEVVSLDQQMIASRNANVRAGPGTSHERLQTLNSGDEVNVTGRSGEWYRIAFAGGRIGYVFKNLLEEKRTGPGVGDAFRDCPECPEMVVIPSGSFMMGSPESEAKSISYERPVHRVSVSQPFAIGKYEVTRGQYAAFANATSRKSKGCWYYDGAWKEDDARDWRSPGYSQTDDDPVVCVGHEDAKAYTGWLGRETGHGYRLPSEAEWEYAARAGTTTPFHFGRTISTDQANYDGNYTYGGGRKGVYRERTVPVGSFPSNAFGLHDVHGNVWEWVEDCWNESYADAPSDSNVWTAGDCVRRVLRGGSWFSDPRVVRSASRGDASVNRYYFIGFRIARTLAD